MMRGKLLVGMLGLGFAVALVAFALPARAADPPSDFSLQITPSPLVTTVKPGTKTQVELKIRNNGTGTEDLKIEPRSFTYNSDNGKVDLDDATSPPVASWITFSQPKFSVQPGQWLAQQITFNVPKDAGFSYSFALVISRQSDPKPTTGERLIKGSIAIFTLINVDRPGAKSNLEVVSFSSDKNLYEYLPATFNIRFRNNGNTIVQPYGNIFVGRSENSKTSLGTLKVNETKAYILPSTERTVSAEWNGGFATYQTVKDADGNPSKQLQVDWSQLSHFRIGRYTAKLIAVYSDGQHDIPIEGVVTFWVVPWRAILLFIAIVTGLWFLSRWRNKRRTEKAVRRALAAQAAASERTIGEKAKEKVE